MYRDKFCINFTIQNEGEQFSAKNDEGLTSVKCMVTEDMLDFCIIYDFRPSVQLHLTSVIKIGDTVTVKLLPHRLELYVNGVLCDEEWPCGKHYISDIGKIENKCGFTVSEAEDKKEVQPSVIGTFKNAEGWKPDGNVFVGDCMPFSHEGRYHVLYLKDRRHHGSKFGAGAHQWSHVSTEDFVNWEIHPMAVEIDDPNEGSICTGSWMYDGEKHYLFYTVRTLDGSPAKICRSISHDGYHFEKDKSFSFTLTDKYTGYSARDPKVVKAEDGTYHMFLTTSLASPHVGCLAHLISENLDTWTECDDPIYICPEEAVGEPECTDYFHMNGYYYLVFSLKGKGRYYYSKKPFTEWQTPEDFSIPCKTVPKGAIWNDRLIFTGFDGKGYYAGTLTFMEATIKENREFAFKKLEQ